ncbi:ribbon-helix-helix domain-containing protein [Sulfitobacter sp. R18_1]|uniref:ribbon-helix-helix domain-containing protein n=1 Tax=Sulfitobacter sp. R18_1 TaxID=2821104 RepID=UPI001ADAF96E|nr:ribbon-helix-helix domain-containing protein [Sulfitobacter sp. R18_1]MBO9428474.1 hypothetical protein [Sulfitobacter sp. R18_1]
MKLKNKLPPSRQGKQQVIAYVEPALAERVHQKAENEGKTTTEVVAEALNSYFVAEGRAPVFPLGHLRIVRRRKGVSKVRNSSNAPACRSGTRPVGAWFDAHLVKMATDLASETGVSKQEMLTQGLKNIVSGPTPA